MDETTQAQLGDRVRDPITGFTGIVVAVAQHITGCDRCAVSAPVDKDGKMGDVMWIDRPTLEIVEAGVITPQRMVIAEPEPIPDSHPAPGGFPSTAL
jgi:hypothetical protein